MFTGRGVLAVWLGVLLAALIVSAFGVEAMRQRLEQEPARGLPRGVRILFGVVVVVFLVGTVPTALAVDDVRALMEDGRQAAAKALAAAREGDEPTAEIEFRRAAGAFQQASDKIDSPTLSGGLLIPGLASNLRAARTLADIGLDLARAGEDVTAAVDPSTLEVVDGRLPVEEVRRVTPALGRGAVALEDALARLDDLDDPYQLSVVSDARDDISRQLRRAARRSAQRCGRGGRRPRSLRGRRYAQLPARRAEQRGAAGTGGLIGNWGLLTASDGDLTLGELFEPTEWNSAMQRVPVPMIDAPPGYLERFPFRPQFAMQDANLSQDFPTAARMLLSMAPQVGLGHLDGVIAVDPVGLAALLELTGPIRVPGWPEDITADNVVDITLRDQYSRFENDPGRADFLGDVAREAIDTATSTNLGTPAQIAKILGGAAHEGHVQLAFARDDEQRACRTAGGRGRARAGSVGRARRQHAELGGQQDRLLPRPPHPVPSSAHARRRTDAPRGIAGATHDPPRQHGSGDSGLPEIVIGPFDDELRRGREPVAGVGVHPPRHRAHDGRRRARRVRGERGSAGETCTPIS